MAGAITVLGALGCGRHSYTVILTSMKEALGLSEVQAGDLATSNLVGSLVSSVLCGLLASRFGPRGGDFHFAVHGCRGHSPDRMGAKLGDGQILSGQEDIAP